jgi:predicted nucleotidyltransferase
MAHIDIPRDMISLFCSQYQIKRLALFGSVLRDNFRSDSDIDIIVEFLPGKRVSMLAMASKKWGQACISAIPVALPLRTNKKTRTQKGNYEG